MKTIGPRILNYSVSVNGRIHEVAAMPDTPLLWIIRDWIGLTGTKYGCGIGACGACTVHANGKPVKSCQLRLEHAQGLDIVTIEGLSGPEAEAVSVAWQEIDVVQCGYCQSGQIMRAAALLTENVKPGDREIERAMDGNICRCATYHRIRAAIRLASNRLGSRK